MNKIQGLKSLGLSAEQIEGVLKLFQSQTPGAIRTRRWRHGRDVTSVTPTVTTVTPTKQNQRVKASQCDVGGKGALTQGKTLSIDSPKVIEMFSPESLPESINPGKHLRTTHARARPKTATRLADDWMPDSADTDRVADQLRLDPVYVGLELEKFRDHFTANGKTMINWQAAWRGWMRRSVEFSQQGRKTYVRSEKPTTADKLRSFFAKEQAKRSRGEGGGGAGPDLFVVPKREPL